MAPRSSSWYSGLSNRLQIKLLRFYMANFYSLGLMRLKYDKSKNRVQMTPNSVKVSWAVGGFFLLSHIFYWSFGVFQRDMEMVVFSWCLLLQPRSVFEKRVVLINRILRISPRLHGKCKQRLLDCFSWTTPLMVLYRLNFIVSLIEGLLERDIFHCSFLLPILISDWYLYLTIYLISTGITTVHGYFQYIHETIKTIEEKLPLAIHRMQHNRIRSLQRRLKLLQNQQQSCRRITELAFQCLGPQLFLMVYYSVNYLVPIFYEPLGSYNPIELLVLTQLMRSFFISLNELSTVYYVSHNTFRWHRTYRSHFDEVLCYHTWIDKCLSTWRVEDWSEGSVQDSMHYLLHPKLQILGMFTLDKRFVLRIFLLSCSLGYYTLVIHKDQVLDNKFLNFS